MCFFLNLPKYSSFPSIVLLYPLLLLFIQWINELQHSLKPKFLACFESFFYTFGWQRFQEDTDLEQFSKQQSSPEELLNFTSELFARFLKVGCNGSITSCSLPTLPPSIERKDYGPSRMRLLTTRAISSGKRRWPERRIDATQPPANGAPSPTAYYTSVWSPLLFRLYWWFWP